MDSTYIVVSILPETAAMPPDVEQLPNRAAVESDCVAPQPVAVHAEACDFISKKVWTLGGLVDYFILFFIHVDTRKVHIAGITPNPDGRWMAQQARNMCMFFDDWPHKPEYIVCDRDTKFTEQFEGILKSEDIELKRTAVQAPNQNAYAERFAQAIQQECLDHFVVLGEKHLRYIIQEFVAYYNEQRPHSSRGYLPLSLDKPPDPVECLGPEDVECHERLGGLLKYYERKAA